MQIDSYCTDIYVLLLLTLSSASIKNADILYFYKHFPTTCKLRIFLTFEKKYIYNFYFFLFWNFCNTWFKHFYVSGKKLNYVYILFFPIRGPSEWSNFFRLTLSLDVLPAWNKYRVLLNCNLFVGNTLYYIIFFKNFLDTIYSLHL